MERSPNQESLKRAFPNSSAADREESSQMSLSRKILDKARLLLQYCVCAVNLTFPPTQLHLPSSMPHLLFPRTGEDTHDETSADAIASHHQQLKCWKYDFSFQLLLNFTTVSYHQSLRKQPNLPDRVPPAQFCMTETRLPICLTPLNCREI